MFRGVWKTVKTKVEKIRIAKTEKKRKMEVKKVVEEWEIQDKEKEIAKSEKKAKKLGFPRFYK